MDWTRKAIGEPEMKLARINRKIGVMHAVKDIGPCPDTDAPLDFIALAAFYRAEARNFVPGHELGDWLAAEKSFGTSPDRRS